MLRYFLSMAVIAIATTAAVAGEHSDWFTDQRELTLGSMLITDELAAETSDDRRAFVERAPDIVITAGQMPAVNDEKDNKQNGVSHFNQGDKQERPYRPLCDCGCHVPCKDHWSVWDTYCHGDCACTETPCDCSHGNCRMTEDGEWLCNDSCCDVWGPPVYRSDAAVRFGWWTVGSVGSQVKTGEFQDLQSSPFWDVDFISSDRVRTLNVIMSGLDNEANDARVQYYGPEGSGKLDFDRYIRRLDHKPLTGLDLPPGQVPPTTPDGNVITNDLNVGQDYAIRVDELDAKAHGKLMDNVTWRMNVWSQRKFGERQENATAHCFNFNAPAAAGATGNVCHVLSQRQSIDWTTVEVKPEVETKFENVTVNYSHTIRSFGADDGTVSRQYTHFNGFSPVNDQLGPPYDYAIVPGNLTQIDRIKVSANLTECNQFYGNVYIGDTEDELRDMHRNMNGYDLRLTNRAIDQVTLTGYASRYEEDTSFAPFFLTAPPLAPTPNPPTNPSYDQTSLKQPLDYNRTRAGIKASWQPYGDRGRRCSNYGLWDGTSLTSGYEYYQLERDNAIYKIKPSDPGFFAQSDTTTNQIEFGPSTKWSRSFDTYVRYRLQFIENPLVGVSEYSIDDPAVSGTFNSNQPQQVHNVDIGYTWSPYCNFMTTAQFTVRNSWNESQFANFTETNYPMSLTVWYAPTERLSFSGGYAYYSDWIDQNITLGANRGIPTDTETTPWNYTGQNHLFTINANYAWSRCVQLMAGYEWDRGANFFGVPPSPNTGVDWSLLPYLSDVNVITQRVTSGIDWKPYHDTNVYLRYVFYDFNDIGSNLNSGTTNMILAGATRTW